MDYEKLALDVANVDASTSALVATTSLELSDIQVTVDDVLETVQSVQDFLDAPIGDKKEIIMKKLFATASVIAQDAGLMIELPSDPQQIAAVVDDGLTRVKNAYQVGIGLLDPEEALHNTIDRAEARAVAVIDVAFDSGLVNETVSDGIVTLAYSIPEIGPIVGPMAEYCKPYISAVISRVEKPVKDFIKTGISKVASTARSIVHKTLEKVKSYASNLAKKLFSIA